MNKKILFLLLLIILFAGLIRVFQLTTYPEGFHQDEAAFGYNAYSILKTGRDEYGKFLPLILKSFGDNKLALFSYWIVPFIIVFGLTEFAVRFATVFAGILTIILTFLLVKKYTGSSKLSLLTAFILGISPWHIVFSRSASEVMLGLLFFLLSLYLFYLYSQKNKFIWYGLSVLILIASALSYYSTWFPVIFITAIYSFVLIQRKSSVIKSLPYTLLLSLPILAMGVSIYLSGGTRLNQTNYLKNSNVYALLQEQIREDQHSFPFLLTRAFHNKLNFYPNFITRNLFNNLSFNFLFIEGDTQKGAYSIPYSGVLYLWFAPFLFIGLYDLFKNYPIKKILFILGFIFAAFLGSSLSTYGSESLRTLIAAPMIVLLISLGIIKTISLLKKIKYSWVIYFVFCLLFIYQLASFNHQYFWHANVHNPWYRNYGEKEMVESVRYLESNYKNVVIAGNPYIYIYFYNRVSPESAQQDTQNYDRALNELGYRTRTKVGNYLLMPVDCPSSGKLRVLYVCRGTAIPNNGRILKVISYKDNQPAYIIMEFATADLSMKQLLPPNVRYMGSYGVIDDSKEGYW